MLDLLVKASVDTFLPEEGLIILPVPNNFMRFEFQARIDSNTFKLTSSWNILI